MTFSAPTVNSVLSADAALYGFMAVASPDPTMSFAFSEVAQASHKASYLSSPIDATRSHKISGVPTTTGDISASFAYVLDSNDCLLLTHRFEVPMEDNWYETYIDALSGEVRTVVDWVSPGSASKFSLARPDFSSYGTPLLSKVEQGLKAAFDSVLHTADEVVAQLTAPSDEEEETKEPSYRVFQWGENDPSEGKRSYESARHDPEVSPFGWHAFPSSRKPFDVSSDKGIYKDGNLTKFKDTRGNNVFVSWGGKTSDDAWSVTLPRPQGEVINGSRHFGYPYPWRKFDLAHKPLDPKNYSLASQTQLFYTINEYHDLLHHYGFDGAAGNGEEYSEKGKDGDAIIAFAQSAAGLNNADMATPPDGLRGRMRMYSWSGQPMRDGSFESGIVLHEYTHFVSTRLTGGPSDSSCLGYGEAGGMGEGWGDIIATMARDRNGSTLAFSMGEWASNHTGGIRRWPYSRNITLDPDTYETLNKPGYWAVHQIGSVWATIVLDVVDHAMEELGFTPDLFPPAKDASKEARHKFYLSEEELSSLPGVKPRKSKKPVPRHGNTLLLQLLIDGMKIQPCRPDFLAARDAIIKADEILSGGANECLLKHSFAKRGLGTDARVVGSTPWGGGIRTNGHQVPSYCNGTHHK
jgi:extracellular elastinolytic metalloproteinase